MLCRGPDVPNAVPLGTVRNGFTFIELLVVIAIIAILASLLLPTLSRGKGKAQTVACLNNLKQLQLGSIMYVGDNSDFRHGETFSGEGSQEIHGTVF
jgi:prepilin-type N-terminal cleavage/methylation domain-containing protein